MTSLPSRLSFIGKRPINFLKSEVSVDIISNCALNKFVKFGQLPFLNTVRVAGKFGTFDINLVDGLNCQISEGATSEESKILININKDKYVTFNKYQKSFLNSMHGTTNSLLMRYIEGISEVNANCYFSFTLFFFRDIGF
jgi:hypothetical protein